MNLADIKMDVSSLPDCRRQRGIKEMRSNSLCGMKREAHGARKPRHIQEYVEVASAAQRVGAVREPPSPAKTITPRFRVAAGSADRALLFNRFLWNDYSNRKMDANAANAPHIVMRCTGEMLADPLLRSIEILLERHDVLNSSIEAAGGNLYLVRNTNKTVAFREVTAAGKTAEEIENEAYRIANSFVWEEYDLDNGPLYRVFLIRLSVVEYILGVALHHAIGDLISIGILFQELSSIYGSVMSGTPLRVMPVRLRYMDYLTSMESWSVGAVCEEHIRYWVNKLKSAPVTDLLPNEKRGSNETVSGLTAEKKFQLDAETSRDLKKTAAQLKTTLFTVLLSIYKIAIRRMTGQDEPAIVALHSGRLDAGFQNAIGNFALEVAYKTCLAGNPGFTEVAGRITRAMNEAESRQPVPLDWVRRALAKEDIMFCAPGINFISGAAARNKNPLAPHQLYFTPPGAGQGCHGFQVSCAIEFRDVGDAIKGSLVYMKGLYDESTIHAFMNSFVKTVSDVISESEVMTRQSKIPEM